MRILILHGPNLNLLGLREPAYYGNMTLEKINDMIADAAKQHGVEVEFFHSNHEGALIDRIHAAIGSVSGILFNPGAFTHTSIALRDAVLAGGIPTVEVHLSNIYAREPFRQKSLLSDIVIGVVSGFKEYSYILGFEALIRHLKAETE